MASDPNHLDGTLAADHPRIVALAADVDRRRAQGRPADRERALLAELLERSRARHAARLARIPEPRFPEDLPIAQHRDEIARLVREHPVTIVCGETGSGKTTQIPKICLGLGRGAAGLIGCTQPRRIAARSLANRLSVEIPGAPKGFVGHKIRFQDQTRPDTIVKVMTDGILLAETHSDRELRAYDTIVIDEAHERSLNVDFLLGYVKRLVAVRPELKVIVTSATIDTARFSEFFDGAPVIEVSGRTFPVEVRYRPEFFEPEEADDEPVDMPEAIAKAVDEIARGSRDGDILVFLPGEREIREAAEVLRKHHPKHTEILPLFSRLSAEEQDRVFERSAHRRIVLATNVAETSLTVPGIHYVIDTGLARIKRYSPRQKIDQLRIEPVSQAAAKQRAGRCGRVASGIAIRLYAEADYEARPAFTTPEILRTSLASVILRMAALELGPVGEYPFIEPPTPRQVEDGYRLLFELGAIGGVPPTGTGSDSKRNLTPLGKELARLPVDPRIGRLLLAAREFHCATEMVILAAALSIQDPRDRPQALREASDRAHEEFRDESSDFLQLLNLWKFFDNEFVHKKSNRKLYETCREHFLSYVRMREWRDLAGQLREMASELRLRDNPTPATYEQMHRALLAGLIGNVGMKAPDGDHYNGPRGLQFHIWPGSGLRKGRPRWIMAGELQETTRVFARNVARIEPEWIERAAAHLVERAWVEPHWDKARGEVVAYESVTLHGLVLVARRKVSFGRLDPVRAREVFIESALVAGEFESAHPFWAHNRKLVREVEELEHRARRPDVMVDDRAIYEFYARQVPEDVRDARSFEAWYREAAAVTPSPGKQPPGQAPGGTRLLFLAKADLMRHGAESVTEELFPRELKMGGGTFPLAYRFEPGHPLDGVTMNVALALLNQVDDATVDWLVPGMIREKVAWLMKALPKKIRTQLVPVPEHVTRFLERTRVAEKPVADAVLEYASRIAGERLDSGVWSKDAPPPHLQMNIRVVDEAKRELAMGRDLADLRKRLGEAASLTLAKAQPGIERENVTTWDFGELPEQVTFRRGNQTLTGYPALSPRAPAGDGPGPNLAIRLFDTPDKSRDAHREGVKLLMARDLKEQLRNLERMSGFNAVALKFQATIAPDKLKADLVEAIVDRAFIGEDELPRTPKAFEEQKKRAKARLPAVTEAALRHLAAIVEASQHYGQVVAQSGALGRVVQEVKAARERLVYPGFLARTPWERLEHLPRYLRGYALRLTKYRTNAERDQKHAVTLQALWEKYAARLAADRDAGRHDPRLEEFRWLIEELRVSLFAQELRTPLPVSAKRLQKFWDEHLR